LLNFYRRARKVFSQSSQSFRAENFRKSSQSYPSNHFIPIAVGINKRKFALICVICGKKVLADLADSADFKKTRQLF